jgi:ribosomal protein S12 methylthiotransferase
MRRNKRISIISLGCPKNLVDSEDLINRLYREGFVYTEEPEDAGLILVNTCGFIEDAKRESIEEILRFRETKKHGKRLIVFGCLAKRYREELIKEIPEIDAIYGVGEEDEIVNYCRSISGESENGRPSRQDRAYLQTGSYAYLKIAEGCNRGCTFCVIPSIRGPYRSLSPDEVINRAEGYISSGIKELILVAQDISSYGRDLRNGYDLSSLLKDIASIKGDFWIRLLYLYPSSIDDRLIETIAEEVKICNYLDIPLQHSEEGILKAMGRWGSKEHYKRLIMRLRDAIPGVTIRTTFIVGFPGEKERDFEGLKRFVEEMEFDRLGVFTYSREEGTKASRLDGQIPKRVREKRRAEIMSTQSRISLNKNLESVGHVYRALIDEVNGEIAIARLYSQAPEIDGVVIIEDSSGLEAGDFVDVKIIEAFDYDLKAEVLR